ncbi:MAG: type IX secretion system membrane protein PorP/SprF [Saprospiraceae bacterium]|nr:type IX secretion system membrane protein PorP/SprF [Saprospiraceae bacterium]
MYRNQSLYNPSATGRMGDFHSGLAYRIQWLGIDGAPSTLAGNFEKVSIKETQELALISFMIKLVLIKI